MWFFLHFSLASQAGIPPHKLWVNNTNSLIHKQITLFYTNFQYYEFYQNLDFGYMYLTHPDIYLRYTRLKLGACVSNTSYPS